MLAIIPAAGTDKVFKTSLKHVLDEDFLFAMASKQARRTFHPISAMTVRAQCFSV